MPSETMLEALSEYEDRRKTFREWLLRQLRQGVHFGFPPGCQPRKDVDPLQWQQKPSLYKAGADFMCDLMGVRDEYEADTAAWEQLGQPKGTFVFACRLFSRKGDLIGEGRGAFCVGNKGMKENAALKMAKKCAKVDAVINSWGLSDLFTQDVEDGESDPRRTARKPQKAPVTSDELTAMWNFWKSQNEQGEPQQFRKYLSEWADIPADKVRDPKAWDRRALEICQQNLGMMNEDTFSV